MTAGCSWKSGADETKPVTVSDTLDPVERAERLLEHGQGIEGAYGGRLPPLLDGDGVAQSAEARELTLDARQLARRARRAVVDDDGVERVVRRVRPVQREAQLGQPRRDLSFCHQCAAPCWSLTMVPAPRILAQMAPLAPLGGHHPAAL